MPSLQSSHHTEAYRRLPFLRSRGPGRLDSYFCFMSISILVLKSDPLLLDTKIRLHNGFHRRLQSTLDHSFARCRLVSVQQDLLQVLFSLLTMLFTVMMFRHWFNMVTTRVHTMQNLSWRAMQYMMEAIIRWMVDLMQKALISLGDFLSTPCQKN